MSNERFSRIEQMIGAKGVRQLQEASVLIVGLGAVGSYAVEALARSGIGRLTLIDCDQIRLSNLNRQLFALESTVGLSKALVAKARVLDINPDCQVEARELFVHHDTLTTALSGKHDLVIDAIDSLGPKVELLAALLERRIPLISSMGAALRTDPSRVKIGSLKNVTHCPLARFVRQRLRRKGHEPDLCCVYSDEPMEELPESVITRPDPEKPEHLKRGRVRNTLGSLPTLTAIFGLTAANQALKMLLEEKKEPLDR